MKKIFSFLIAISCLTSVAAQTKEQETAAVRKLGIAQYAVSHLYVDSVDLTKITEGAIKGMLSTLDPHSTYTNAAETKAMNEPLEGNFDGIGVQFNMLDDTLLVIQTVDKGPSQKAGILAGDRIVRVNDTVIAGVKMPQTEIMKRLRGKKGTTVHLGIRRTGVAEEIQFDVVRDKIPVHTLDAAYIIAPKVGYVRFGSFGKTTHDEVRNAILGLKEKGAESLIVDVRENGGGFLEAAIEVANEFLAKGDMIVYTQGRAVPKVEYKARGGGIFTEGKTVVLVDEFSASASEILAGALQDQDRATIVGVRSFGKGLVQQPVGLPDGSLIRLTVARYYTPSGRCIQKPYASGKGEDMLEQYHKDLTERFNHGELMHADSIHFPDSLKYQTKLLERTVYGGGGIMPDFFVPIDTTRYTEYHRNLVAKGVIIRTTTGYIEKHRAELKQKYPTFDSFNRKFQVDEQLLADLRALGEKEKVKFDQEQHDRALPLITTQLKALIARDLWDMSEYFQVMNETNESVQQAIRVLKEGMYEKVISSWKKMMN